MISSTAWTVPYAAAFCFVCSSSYVVALYLIPRSVRVLPRDHVVHVRIIATGRISISSKSSLPQMKFRMGASIVVTCAAVLLFCSTVPTYGVSSWAAMGFVASHTLDKVGTTALLMGIFYLGS
jgi:hypothetical protein